MLKEEFEKLTGFYPTDAYYRLIEAAYMNYPGNKTEFCKAYSENAECMAEQIQYAADTEYFRMLERQAKEIRLRDAQIENLKKALEKELEWKPYEDRDNVSQIEYTHLKLASGTRILKDEEAKELLYYWYGFSKDKIKILCSIPLYEINRHRILRKVGETDRKPLYNSTDWNYIRFDCGSMCYELHNDNLNFFYN